MNLRRIAAAAGLLLAVTAAVFTAERVSVQNGVANASAGLISNRAVSSRIIGPASVVMTFTSSGTWAAPVGVTAVEYLVVGGGGGGGSLGGGGGCGGYRAASGFAVTPGASYTITVGAGGPGGVAGVAGSNGGDSTFSTITSTGGGYGGGNLTNPSPGGNGGCGGGAGSAGAGGTGGTGNTPATTPAQGTNGGNGAGGGTFPSGGGGGASAAGTTSNGGAGTANSITGASIHYAAGGGGGTQGGTAGTAGNACAGNGKNTSVNGDAAQPNTGCGGGGGGWSGSYASGGLGGSGIVVLKYNVRPVTWLDGARSTLAELLAVGQAHAQLVSDFTYFAEIDGQGNVLRVIVADPDFIQSGKAGDSSKWIQTWIGGGPRKNFAAPGMKFDGAVNAFVFPKPYPSWIFDTATARWEPPIPYPNSSSPPIWNESSQTWQVAN